ncbi:alpha-amylase family protein [Nakamurella endophytica]|uniref:Alpha-amylase n=1 Tax=Nakamurella endophytica TaxID=1748367 RepID=A0A917TD75_9ACTN|nr:alpha-amylase family protein [Nakamurella endophytica]GGM16295.1 alpha-amylase [Nakamurella endophytica]
MAADWIEHCIWWHVYPLGFAGAPIRDRSAGDGPAPGDGLRRLVRWLDHAVRLGVNGLLLGPVFAAETHGYDTLDHFRIDERLGTDEDFDALVRACRERGLRVVLDGVFNHVGAGHPAAIAAPATAGDGRPDAGGWLRRAADGRPVPFEGHDGLLTLDHDSPAVADHTVRVLDHWLHRGVDGWRLDAAYAVPPAFWAHVLPRVREQYPDAWFVGEVIHGDYADLARRSGIDSVTQYELWKAIWSSLADRNFFELDWALQRHADLLDRLLPQTFVGNHDVTRIASRVGPQAAELALAVLMTVGGIPSVYYGDEWGRTGVKEDRLGGDDAVRPAFPAAPAEPADAGQARLLRVHQDLIGLRRRHPWLVRARTRALELGNTRYRYEARSADGGQHLVVELDVTGRPTVRITDAAGATVFDSPR